MLFGEKGIRVYHPQMASQVVAPYGSWKSPITSDLIVAETISLGQIALDGEAIYWLEGRPSENGRYVVVKWENGQKSDVTPPGFNARTRVHEYGGGAFTVHSDIVYFSNYVNQQLYRQQPVEVPEAVTPVGKWRYADGVILPPNRMICVREDHTVMGGQDAVNTIVVLRLDGEDSGKILVSGNDFYASPLLSPDGRQLAWLTWNRPNMPWDGTELWVADLTPEGILDNHQLVAGGEDESIYQPERREVQRARADRQIRQAAQREAEHRRAREALGQGRGTLGIIGRRALQIRPVHLRSNRGTRLSPQ
jgi:hypothetical protein